MNLNNISETELLQLADDMVANITNLNPQNYAQFIESREEYKKKIQELVRSVYELKENILSTHEQEYLLFRATMSDFLDSSYKHTQKALERQCT